jgi:hypothetical protein
MAPKSGSAELLAALRAAMATQGLAALVVPSEGQCQWSVSAAVSVTRVLCLLCRVVWQW